MKKHYSLTVSDDINTICQPLEELGISSFSFVRSFVDASFTVLTSRPDWTEYFLNKQYYHTSVFEQGPVNYQSGIILWSCVEKDKALTEASDYFNMNYGVSLIDRHADYCDMYHFGSTNNNWQIQNFYLSNLDIFKKFTLFFKEVANGHIKKSESHKIKINATPEEQLKITSPLKYIYTHKIEHNKCQFKLKRFYLNGNFEGKWLTNRECICISWLIAGKTLSEIGIILGISSKTVEEYIGNVKRKTNCFKQTSLVYKLIQQGFDPSLFI